MAKQKSLVTHVHLIDPETNEQIVFGPGDDLPKWARDQITNPAAFESDQESVVGGGEPDEELGKVSARTNSDGAASSSTEISPASSEEDLIAWLSGGEGAKKATIGEVEALLETYPDMAEAIAGAETAATNGKPRAGVSKAVAAVIEAAQEPEETTE